MLSSSGSYARGGSISLIEKTCIAVSSTEYYNAEEKGNAMSEKFIVAVDGSKNSFSASEQAIEIAKYVSASLHFVYVVDIRKVEIPLFYQSASFDVSFEKVYIPPAPGLKEF